MFGAAWHVSSDLEELKQWIRAQFDGNMKDYNDRHWELDIDPNDPNGYVLDKDLEVENMHDIPSRYGTR